MLERFKNADRIQMVKIIHEIDLKNNSYNFSLTIYEPCEVTSDRGVNAKHTSSHSVSFPVCNLYSGQVSNDGRLMCSLIFTMKESGERRYLCLVRPGTVSFAAFGTRVTNEEIGR